MQGSQLITEAGTVIGFYGADGTKPLRGETDILEDVVAKADPTPPKYSEMRDIFTNKATEAGKKTKATHAQAKEARRAAKKLAPRGPSLAGLADLMPTTKGGKAALVAVPAVAAVAGMRAAQGHSNHPARGVGAVGSKIKSATGDVRRYRPASTFYDDGIDKSAATTGIKAAESAAAAALKKAPVAPRPALKKAPVPSAAADQARAARAAKKQAAAEAATAKRIAEGRVAQTADAVKYPGREQNPARAERKAHRMVRRGTLKAPLSSSTAWQSTDRGARRVGSFAVNEPEKALGLATAGGSALAYGAAKLSARKAAKELGRAEVAAAARKQAQITDAVKVGAAATGGVLAANAAGNKMREFSTRRDATKMRVSQGRAAQTADAIKYPDREKNRALAEQVAYSKAGVPKFLKAVPGKLKQAAENSDKIAEKVADVSGHGTRIAANAKNIKGNIDQMVTGKPPRKPGLTGNQKLMLGGAAAAGGLLVGRQLTTPRPYPYQQQRG